MLFGGALGRGFFFSLVVCFATSILVLGFRASVLTLGSATTILLFWLRWDQLDFLFVLVYGVSFAHVVIEIILPILIVLVFIFNPLVMHPDILFTYFQDGFSIEIILCVVLFVSLATLLLNAIILFMLVEALAEVDLLVTAPAEVLRTNMTIIGLGCISVDGIC